MDCDLYPRVSVSVSIGRAQEFTQLTIPQCIGAAMLEPYIYNYCSRKKEKNVSILSYI